MSHSIKETRIKNPMWYFERNFAVLTALVDEIQLEHNRNVSFELAGCPVEISLIENTRYTSLIKIRHKLNGKANLLSDIVFDIRVYQDAQLAEVISYQGRSRIQFKYEYPNNNMYLPDEKRQGNLLLHDWLSTCARLNYKDNLIEKV